MTLIIVIVVVVVLLLVVVGGRGRMRGGYRGRPWGWRRRRF